MRRQLAERPRPSYLRLARPLILDRDSDCRWQALILVGAFIRTDPEAVWRVLVRHARTADADLRAGLATILLENLLEQHFGRYFPRVRRRVLAGSDGWTELLGICSPFGRSASRWGRVRALLRRAAGV